MKLITKEIRNILPKLYEQDSENLNAIAYVKFFTPDSNCVFRPHPDTDFGNIRTA